MVENILTSLFFIGFLIGVSILILKLLFFLVEYSKPSNRWKRISNNRNNPIEKKKPKIFDQLEQYLELAEAKINAKVLIFFTFVLGVVTYVTVQISIEIFSHRFLEQVMENELSIYIISLCLAALITSLPYFYLVFKVQRKRHLIAVQMITLVQNFLGHYHQARSIPEIIKSSLATMPEEVRYEWNRLILSIHVEKSLDNVLYEFARRLDNHWADQLIDILLIGNKNGVDITDSLHRLIKRMQASKALEEKRIAMITIYRIGTILMVFFNIGFIVINIYIEPASYRIYFQTENGKMLIILSVMVMFICLLSVIRTGKRQF